MSEDGDLVEQLVQKYCCVVAGNLVPSSLVATEEALRDALKEGRASSTAAAVGEPVYPSDPYIDTMAVNACVAGDGKGRLIFTIQAARKFALDVLRARDDGAFEAVAVGEPIGWRQRWPNSSVDPNNWSANFSDDAAYCNVMIEEMRAHGAIAELVYGAPTAPAKAIDAGAAARLRLLCKMIGLENAVPTSNEELMGAQFSVFGLMRAKIERLNSPAPIASSLSDRDIQEAALEWRCDPAFDHFVFHEDELVEYVRGILARVRSAASRAEVLEEACAAIKAEDDRQADDDYMLDSDDCIRVIRALKDKP